MTKINNLPSLSLQSSYEDNFLLAANGYDDNGDYVTGQVSSHDLINSYIRHVSTEIHTSDDRYLFVTYYNTDMPHMCGELLSELAANIASSISEYDYLSNYISSSISDYTSSGYFDDYLSTYISNYIDSGYTDNYLYSYIGSYLGDIGVVSYTSEITGIVVTQQGSLKYVECSSAYDFIYNTVFYGQPYPEPLSDATRLAVVGSYLSAYLIAPVTLGDIVSYIKSQI